MTGRKPKPMALRMSEGDTRKIGAKKLAALAESEPKAQSGLPKCPSHLKGRSRQAWEFWSEQLQAMNIDKRPDAQMLEGAAVNYARAVEADILVEKDGLVVLEPIVSKGGEVVGEKRVTNPAIAISNAAWNQVRAFCAEFGFSPVSRTRLANIARDPKPTEDLMAILRKPRPQDAEIVQ